MEGSLQGVSAERNRGRIYVSDEREGRKGVFIEGKVKIPRTWLHKEQRHSTQQRPCPNCI